MPLTTEQAKEFFGSLYEHEDTPDLNEFDSAAIRLVARIETSSVPGDRALGLLMLNHVMGAPKTDAKTKSTLTAAVLMNIKQIAVDGFLQAFPDMTLDRLVEAAKDAGYEVDVLAGSVANNVPRSVVGRLTG